VSVLLSKHSMARRRLRVSGAALSALARLLATPVAGPRIAERLMREMLLDRLRRHQVPDAVARPVIVFRAGPKPPTADGDA
jgi:hypothetical protein